MAWRIAVVCLGLLPAIAAAAGVSSAQEESWAPFPVDWKSDAERTSPVDLSFLLDVPAGQAGRMRIADGHLVRGDGRRLRLWGINVSMAAGLPAQENAPRIARRLAETGINCVRFHFLDVPAPRGLIAADRDDTQHLDPAQLDRLDRFIAELKQRGIYADLNLNVAHPYKPGDGVRDYELLGFAKALTYFDPRLIELQKQYARMLLTHRNPYTGSAYNAEPAVALVELLNENSLVESWINGRLLGRNTRRNPGTWSDIPASYEPPLTERYNAWLKDELSAAQLAKLRAEAGMPAEAAIPRLKPGEFPAASRLRFQTEAAFYVALERQYFDDMAQFLRDELGVKAPLIGSSDHNHGQSGYPHESATSRLDVVDGHVYWQHPSYIRDPETNRTVGFRIANTPMVLDPLKSTVVQLARSAVAGKPYTVSEVNHPFPAEFAAEGIPLLAAYAAFQDWDGIFWYTLGHEDPVAATAGRLGHFDFFPDPVKMAELRAGALLFLRGDVAPARTTVTRTYSREQVLESLRLPRSESPWFTPGFDAAIPLTHAVRMESFDGAPTSAFERVPHDPTRSDTGELTWSQFQSQADRKALVTIQTPRSQALVGHCASAGQALGNLSLETTTPFCAVTLAALDRDRAPIAAAERLLLAVCGRVANSAMRRDARRTTLEEWGDSPVRIEAVGGSVVLRDLEGPVQSVAAQPLDGAGRALGSPLAAVRTPSGWSIPLGNPPTTWYCLTVHRR
jgi:hypothetical protein